MSYIDWESISNSLTKYGTKKQKSVWMEWSKSIGDWIEKRDTIAIIFEYYSSESTQNIDKSNNNMMVIIN